jgi:hypothetical protein
MVKEQIRSSEYDLLIQRFDMQTTLINAQFTGVNERLDKINGRVGKHDEQINESLTERAKNRQEQSYNFHKLDEVIKKVDELKEIESHHITTCPQADRVRTLEDKQVEYEAIVKSKSIVFSKTAQMIIVFIMFAGLTISLVFNIANYQSKKEIRYIPIDAQSKFRGEGLDSIYWNDTTNPAPIYKY